MRCGYEHQMHRATGGALPLNIQELCWKPTMADSRLSRQLGFRFRFRLFRWWPQEVLVQECRYGIYAVAKFEAKPEPSGRAESSQSFRQPRQAFDFVRAGRCTTFGAGDSQCTRGTGDRARCVCAPCGDRSFLLREAGTRRTSAHRWPLASDRPRTRDSSLRVARPSRTEPARIKTSSASEALTRALLAGQRRYAPLVESRNLNCQYRVARRAA